MNKKIIPMMCCVLLLAGCSGASTTTTEKDNETGINTQNMTTAATDQIEIETTKEAEEIPNSVQDIFTQYIELKNKYAFVYEIVSTPSKGDIGGYSFDLNEQDGNLNYNDSVHFIDSKTYENPSYYTIVEVSGKQYLKDFITSTCMVADNNISLDDAKEYTKEIVNSYSKDAFSKVVICGDYSIFMTPEGTRTSNICAININSIFPVVDKNIYSEFDYQSYSAPEMNQGTRYFVNGKVTETYFGDGLEKENCYLKVTGENGEDILLTYDFMFNPKEFKVGDNYVFYGFLSSGFDGNPFIMLEYCE